MRSSSCSIVAWALGGPPHSRRSSAWILPCGRPVRWWCAATSALSWRRRAIRRSPADRGPGGCRGAGAATVAPPRRRLRRQLVGLALGEQHRDLVGGEQPGQAQVLLLLGRARERAGAERGAVEDHLVQLGGRRERLEALLQLAAGLLGPLRPLQQVVVEARPGPWARRARGRARPPSRWPAPAGAARWAGRRWPSRRAGGPARTGRSPGRSRAAWRRWWRTPRRPGAGCRRPRTPSAPRPSSARRTSANVGDPRRTRPASSESTTTAFSPVTRSSSRAYARAGCLVAGDDQTARVGHAAGPQHLQARVGGPQHLRHPVAGRVQRGTPRLRDQVLRHRLAEAGGQLVPGAGAPAGLAGVGQEDAPAARRRRAARRRSRTTESDRERCRPSPPRSYVTNGIGLSSERNGVPVSISRRTAGSNAALTPSPQDRESPAWWISSRITSVRRVIVRRRCTVRRHAHLGVGDDGAVEVGRRSAGRRCGTRRRARCRPGPRRWPTAS